MINLAPADAIMVARVTSIQEPKGLYLRNFFFSSSRVPQGGDDYSTNLGILELKLSCRFRLFKVSALSDPFFIIAFLLPHIQRLFANHHIGIGTPPLLEPPYTYAYHDEL